VTSVLIFALLLTQQVAPPEKCVLAGTAVDSITGTPLAKVEIVAEHLSGNDPGASTSTDAKGNFRMVEVDPGQYRLSAKRNGYLDTYYGARKSSARGSTITLTAGQQLEDLKVKLTPFGAITGSVRDADGEPIVAAVVELYSLKSSNGKQRIQGWDTVSTNDLGEYRLADLPSGRYYISAKANDRGSNRNVDHSPKSDNPPVFPIMTFYPGTSDPVAASVIEVSAGERVTNANITMIRSPLYSVSLHVETPAGMKAHAALDYSTDGFGSIAAVYGSDKDGNVRLTGIPPGSYVAKFNGLSPQKPFDGTVDMYADDGNCNTATVPVIVERADVEGLRVTVQGCGQVVGHVSFEGGDSKEHQIFAELDAGTGRREVMVKADGTFRIGAGQGQHAVNISLPSGLYVKSMRSGNQDVLRQGFTVGALEQVDLEVVMAMDGGDVDGVVTNADDAPVSDAIVVLIPNDPVLRTRRDFTWKTVADQAGHFELKGVAPGEYKAYAWDDIEEDGWFDPEVLKTVDGKGESASVKAKAAGGQESASPSLKLRMIP